MSRRVDSLSTDDILSSGLLDANVVYTSLALALVRAYISFFVSPTYLAQCAPT